MTLNNNSTGPLINYYLKTLNLRQEEIAKELGVTQPAIAMAISNYKGNHQGELRTKIIDLLKSKLREAA